MTNSNHSFIGGGEGNTVGGGNQTHSFIGGGQNNTVTALHAAILGGIGNTVSHDCAAVFGNGIASVCPDTFHVSCLNAVNTPVAFLAPTGTVMYKTFGTLTATDRVLVIAP